MEFADVRAKYPQYSDLSDEQLAQGLHKKYYSDLPFDKFAAKVGYEPVHPANVGDVPDPNKPAKAAAKKPLPGSTAGLAEDRKSVLGGLEAAGSAITGLPGAAMGAVSGLARIPFTPGFGTQRGVQATGAQAESTAGKLTYQPRTPEGQRIAGQVGEQMQALQPDLTLGSHLAPPPGFKPPPVSLPRLPGRGTAAPDMSGVGAARAPEATLRSSRADTLQLPPLTKGQAERTFEQQRFEREKAKDAELGEPLRERFAEQNEQVIRKFDQWIDETGTQAPDIRSVGKSVDAALVKKAQAAKGAIRAEYQKADAAGETAAPVSTQPIVDYLESTRPESINAPILQTIEQKLIQLKGATKGPDGKLVAGQMTLKDLEELRKMIGRASQTTPTNIAFGTEAKKVIDAGTANAGGPIYARARRLRQRYAEEFEDRSAIERLMSTKPGTKDRSVAFEDVFKEAMLNGSLDDVRWVRKTLQTGGDEGKQAWQDLQGATVNHIKQIATDGVSRDTRGNPVVSPAKLNKAVTELDRDGKLDFIFGKQGAQQIRDIAQYAVDTATAPSGTVNTSNTAGVILQALDAAASAGIGIPAPVASGIAWGKKKLQTRQARKQIGEALDYPNTPGQLPPPP